MIPANRLFAAGCFHWTRFLSATNGSHGTVVDLKPFEVSFGEDGKPLLTGSRLVEAGSDPVCANLRTDLSMRDAGPNRLEVTVPIENRGSDPWRGTVSLVVGGVFIPVKIGLVPPGETRSETLVLRLPEGVTQFDGELLIGP